MTLTFSKWTETGVWKKLFSCEVISMSQPSYVITHRENLVPLVHWVAKSKSLFPGCSNEIYTGWSQKREEACRWDLWDWLRITLCGVVCFISPVRDCHVTVNKNKQTLVFMSQAMCLSCCMQNFWNHMWFIKQPLIGSLVGLLQSKSQTQALVNEKL